MSQNSLPPVHLTGSGCPVFLPGEVECSLISSVDLVSEEEDQNHNFLPSYKSGLLILTTRRLLWISESNGSDPSTTAFIPLASVIHTFPPKKSIKSIFSSPSIRIQLDGRILGVGSGSVSTAVMVTLILRGKKTDPDAFFGRIWEVMRSRAWRLRSQQIRQRRAGERDQTVGMDRAVEVG